MNVVSSPAFLFGIGNNLAESGLSNLMAKVAISINNAIFSIVILPGIGTVSSPQPQTVEYNNSDFHCYSLVLIELIKVLAEICTKSNSKTWMCIILD